MIVYTLFILYLSFIFFLNNFAKSIIFISLYGLANKVSYVSGRLSLTGNFINLTNF